MGGQNFVSMQLNGPQIELDEIYAKAVIMEENAGGFSKTICFLIAGMLSWKAWAITNTVCELIMCGQAHVFLCMEVYILNLLKLTFKFNELVYFHKTVKLPNG